ncbi:9357_t:CDS:1, partial [Cetraspora pellucida]
PNSKENSDSPTPDPYNPDDSDYKDMTDTHAKYLNLIAIGARKV